MKNWFKKAVKYASNPVSMGTDVIKQATGIDATPRINYRGGSLDLGQAFGGPIGSSMAAMSVSDQIEEARKKREDSIALTEAEKTDSEMFQKFSEQDLLNSGDPSGDLFQPKYTASTSGSMSKQTEALISLFNNRKTQILNQRRAPGMSQTRYS
jgi:hypothetical protein